MIIWIRERKGWVGVVFFVMIGIFAASFVIALMLLLAEMFLLSYEFTQHRRTEYAARQSQEIVNAFFSSSTVGFGILDSHFRFTRFNDPASREGIPDPNASTTFKASKLDWHDLAQPRHQEWLNFYRELLKLRAQHIVSRLSGICGIKAEYEVHADSGGLSAHWQFPDLAKLTLARRTLTAPVSGTVWQVRAVAHRPVKTADVLFRVTDLKRLQAELYLPAALQARVHVGDAVRLVPQGGNSTALPVAAAVSAVSPIVDPATSRFRVVLATTSAPPALAGQPVRVEFGAARAPVVTGDAVLPRDAYLERAGDGLFAIRLDHGRARRIAVELGALRADGYEVLGGLAAGDLVLADGAVVPKDSAYVTARLRAAGR